MALRSSHGVAGSYYYSRERREWITYGARRYAVTALGARAVDFRNGRTERKHAAC